MAPFSFGLMGRSPWESSFALLVNDPEVQFLMMPMPRAQPRAGPYDDLRDGKGKGKDEKGKGKKGKGKGFELPQGCSQTTKEGKPICNAYNRQQCSYAKDGKRCKRGFHVCWKCVRPKPYATCTMSDSTTVTHQESVSSHLQVLLIAVLQTASSLILSCQI